MFVVALRFPRSCLQANLLFYLLNRRILVYPFAEFFVVRWYPFWPKIYTYYFVSLSDFIDSFLSFFLPANGSSLKLIISFDLSQSRSNQTKTSPCSTLAGKAVIKRLLTLHHYMKNLISSGTYIPKCGLLYLEVSLSSTFNQSLASFVDFWSYQDRTKDLYCV